MKLAKGHGQGIELLWVSRTDWHRLARDEQKFNKSVAKGRLAAVLLFPVVKNMVVHLGWC